jgi:hypothetical protein
MSMGDYVKYLRAVRGGVTPSEIEEATGIPFSQINVIEYKFAPVFDDPDLLSKLAAYFQVPVEELGRRATRTRKLLTRFLAEHAASTLRVHFTLAGGARVIGQVMWWDRSAVGLRLDGDAGDAVVYRHSIQIYEDA